MIGRRKTGLVYGKRLFNAGFIGFSGMNNTAADNIAVSIFVDDSSLGVVVVVALPRRNTLGKNSDDRAQTSFVYD